MGKKSLSGYYQVAEDSDQKLVLVRSKAGRIQQSIAAGVAGIICILVSMLSWTKTPQDTGGFLFFGLLGLGLGLISLLAAVYRQEIEINPGQQVIERRMRMGAIQISPSCLPFSEVGSVAVVTVNGEFDTYLIQIKDKGGAVWGKIPGYSVRNQAVVLQQKILRLIKPDSGKFSMFR